jgi:hypothetical protein
MKATIIWRVGPRTVVEVDDIRVTGDCAVTMYDDVGHTEQIVNLRAVKQIMLGEE